MDTEFDKPRPPIPLLTYILIGVNILAAAVLFLLSKNSGASYGELLNTYGAKVNSNILSGEYWRFVTPVFLHANIEHLLINSYSLFAVGVTVERIYGRFRYFIVYFAAGICGNILSFVFSPNPGVGASGAIFGLLGALLYFGVRNTSLFRASFGVNILVMIGINLFYGFTNPGIDNYAHIGGLIGGFLAAGAVSGQKNAKWYLNKYAYSVLAVLLAVSGIYYGFNGKEGRIAAKTNELEAMQVSNDWTGAEALAEEILAMDPDRDTRVQTLWTLIYVEEMGQKFDEAVGHANDLIAIDPLSGHYVLGFVYYDMGRYDSSREELLKAKEMGATAEQAEHIDQLLNELEGLGQPGK
ncbi:MAG TPA: rhomboid family intramembrane serine protease [Clostridia bacterium]|nr:rhomboid family intramembrane serine protease [Clostridia bacterium]